MLRIIEGGVELCDSLHCENVKVTSFSVLFVCSYPLSIYCLKINHMETFYLYIINTAHIGKFQFKIQMFEYLLMMTASKIS